MSLVRKVLWPALIAMAFMAFVGLSGNGANSALAYDDDDLEGEFCRVDGPTSIMVGQTALYIGRLDAPTHHDTTVSIDNIVGSSKITSVIDEDGDYKHGWWGDYQSITPNNQIQDVKDAPAFKFDEDLIDLFDEKFKTTSTLAEVRRINTCGPSTTAAITRLITDAIAAGEACAPAGTTGLCVGSYVTCTVAQNSTGTDYAYQTVGTGTAAVRYLCGKLVTSTFPRPFPQDVGLIITQDYCSPGSQNNTSTVCGGAADGPFNDWDIDCLSAATCTIASGVVTAIVNSIVADLDRWIADDLDCEDVAINAAKAAIGQGVSTFVDEQVFDFVLDACNDDWIVDFDWGCDYSDYDKKYYGSDWDKHEDDCKFTDSFVDSFVVVDVTCQSAGNFDITFTDENDATDAISLNVTCRGVATAASTITAVPTSVEIVPALGNVSASLVWVRLVDSTGATTSAEVTFSTDRCAIESSGVDGLGAGTPPAAAPNEFTDARAVFDAYAASATPASAGAVLAHASVTAPIDSSPTQETVMASATTGIAATVLRCDPTSAPGTNPSTAGATVVATIDVPNADDIVKSVNIKVVGPPAALTATASPSTLRCGEKATITVTAKDAVGQNVSDHTRVEAVTNAGGNLGGTGAVAGLAGPVVPVSSTVAETFGGTTTFFLLTSEVHSGPYEVVVTSGGGGSVAGGALGGVFSTPAISVQTTVTCTMPAPPAPAPAPAPQQPTTTAPLTPPRTGTGVTPPNTGDAGLASDSSSSWMLFTLIGGLSLALAGIATVKAARR